MICFKLFPVIFMWWKVYELYLLMKGLICNIISGWLLICLWFNATAIVYWKHFSSLLLRFIVCFLFFSHLKESIHDPPWFKLIFYDTCNRSTLWKTSSLPLIDSSMSFWYLCKIESKSYSLISFVSLPIIISILSFFEWIVRVSLESLEGKELITIFNWIFYSPWILRSFIMSLKYGLVSLRYSPIDRALSLSPLLSYPTKLLSKALIIFTGL